MEVGTIVDGHKYIGGNPNEKGSWILAGKMPPPEAAKGIMDSLRKHASTLPSGNEPKALAPSLSVLDGASFGFIDEVIGGVGGLLGMDKDSVTDYTRNIQKDYADKNPAKDLGLKLAGGLATGYGIAKHIPRGVLNLPKMVQFPLMGGLAGGTAAFGGAEGNTKERLPDAGIGAAAGTVLGLGLPLIGSTLKQPAQWIGNQFKNPITKANQAVFQALERDGLTPKLAADKLKELPYAATISDLGANTQALAGAAVNYPGKAKALGTSVLENRAKTAVNRMLPSLRKLTGGDKKVFTETKNIISRRSEQAAPLYKKIEGSQVQITDDLFEMLDRPSMSAALRAGARKAADEGIALKDKVGAGNWVNYKLFDYAKRSLDDKIGAAIKANQGDKVRTLSNLKNELVDYVDTAVPGYAEARRVFSTESGILNAMKLGKNILKDDFDEMSSMVSTMSNAEKEAFVVGSAKVLRDKLLSVNAGNNAARRLSAPLLRERLRSAFPDDESFNTFMGQLDIEDSVFAVTRNEVLKGSQTSAREAAKKDLLLNDSAPSGIKDYAANAVRDLTSGRQVPDEVMGNQLGKTLFTQGAPNNKVILDEIQKMAPMMNEKQKRVLIDSLMLNTEMQSGAVAP